MLTQRISPDPFSTGYENGEVRSPNYEPSLVLDVRLSTFALLHTDIEHVSRGAYSAVRVFRVLPVIFLRCRARHPGNVPDLFLRGRTARSFLTQYPLGVRLGHVMWERSHRRITADASGHRMRERGHDGESWTMCAEFRASRRLPSSAVKQSKREKRYS